MCQSERQSASVCQPARGSEAVSERPHALLCAVSQSVLSSVEAPAELSCILSWAGPASRGLKDEGWVGPPHSFITISNK